MGKLKNLSKSSKELRRKRRQLRRKQKKQDKPGLRGNTRGEIPLRSIMVVIAVLVIFGVSMMFFELESGSCPRGEQVTLTGFLRGFCRTESGGMWNVTLDNSTYVFKTWDKNYMEGMLGMNVSLTCCYRPGMVWFVQYAPHYDLVSAYITDNSSGGV